MNTNGVAASPPNPKSYSKDIPPGWRPRSYPLREHEENLKVWVRLTTLNEDKYGAAIMSRLDGNALKLAQTMTITRYDTEIEQDVLLSGVDALSLPPHTAGRSQRGVDYPAADSGIKVFLDKLKNVYNLDGQGIARKSKEILESIQLHSVPK